jgi:hypothetical protein
VTVADLLVAVRKAGTIGTSPDGITWTERTSGVTNDLYGVTKARAGNYVAAGAGPVLSSPDAVSWTKRLTAPDTLRAVAHGKGLFVAVGLNKHLYTSPDGVTWTQRDAGMASVDATKDDLFSIHFANDLFVAGGQAGYYITSPDGVTWTLRTFPTGADRFGIAYGAGLWVSVGLGGHTYTSPDAITWTSRSNVFGADTIRAITFADGRFVAVGGQNKIGTSPDGITWTQRTSPLGGASNMHAAGHGNGVYVVGNESGQIATSPDGVTWTARTSGSSNIVYALVTLPPNLPPSAPGAFTSPVSGDVVNTTATVAVGAASDPDGDALTYEWDLSLDNGATWTRKRNLTAGTSWPYDYTNDAATTAAKWRVRAHDSQVYGPYRESPLFEIRHNSAPTAPTPTSPVGGQVVDRTAVIRLAATFNDPDEGDSVSESQWRWRVAGTTTWTTVIQGNNLRYYDIAAGTLDPADYEWQALYKDAAGEPSPWSASEFFTAANPPTGVTITNPDEGATVGQSDVVAWSATEQDAFHARRVADDGGVPAPTTVYYDSGTVVSSTARNHPLTYETNNRYEHVQVRRRVNSLWSVWASRRVLVSYTAPAVPSVLPVSNDATASIAVELFAGAWPVDVSAVGYVGTGNGTFSGPTATDGVTDSHAWTATLVTTAADGGTFDVAVDGTVVGQAVVGTQFTHEGLSFTINDGTTDFALGDKFSWTTTAVKTISQDLWRREGNSGEGIRIARDIPPSGTHNDHTVASGVDYAYRAVAHGDNSTTSESAWTA